MLKILEIYFWQNYKGYLALWSFLELNSSGIVSAFGCLVEYDWILFTSISIKKATNDNEEIMEFIISLQAYISFQYPSVLNLHRLFGSFIWLYRSFVSINTYNAAGVSRRQDWPKCNKFGKKCQHSGIWLLHLESLWTMHSKESKHAWYWFIDSWNRHFRNLRNKYTFFLLSRTNARILRVNVLLSLILWGKTEKKAQI